MKKLKKSKENTISWKNNLDDLEIHINLEINMKNSVNIKKKFEITLSVSELFKLHDVVPHCDLNILYLFADQLKDWSRQKNFRNPKDGLKEI